MQILVQSSWWEWGQEPAFLESSQVLQMLVAWGPPPLSTGGEVSSSLVWSIAANS